MTRYWEPPRLDDRFVTGRDRAYYRKLTDAYEQAEAMGDLGVVAEDLLVEIRRRIERIAALIEADGATSALGGQRNRRLRHYIGEFTALLVDLVDAAVEHQTAALYNDSYVAVTLKDLEERERARGAANDEVAEW